MRISIVTPSYNQGQYLEETIKSILGQGYPDLEYFIFDGGSTDNTTEVMRRYEKELTYCISEKDRGQTDAINKGLLRSSGEIFAWQNSDDTYCEGTFKYVAEIFSKDPKIDIVFGGWNFIDANSKIISSRSYKKFSLLKFYGGLQIPPQPAVFIRHQAIIDAGGFDITRQHVMDFDLYVRILRKDNYYITDRILGNFRIHKDSKTIRSKKEQIQEYKLVREKYLGNRVHAVERGFWFLCDFNEWVKDFIHDRTGVFSFKDLLRKP